ncbi:hypothetical protein B5S33_g2685 [[Candida] boidinii]|nr:hypothetical protein B5S33_g2685 [[Candida] boidinii]
MPPLSSLHNSNSSMNPPGVSNTSVGSVGSNNNMNSPTITNRQLYQQISPQLNISSLHQSQVSNMLPPQEPQQFQMQNQQQQPLQRQQISNQSYFQNHPQLMPPSSSSMYNKSLAAPRQQGYRGLADDGNETRNSSLKRHQSDNILTQPTNSQFRNPWGANPSGPTHPEEVFATNYSMLPSHQLQSHQLPQQQGLDQSHLLRKQSFNTTLATTYEVEDFQDHQHLPQQQQSYNDIIPPSRANAPPPASPRYYNDSDVQFRHNDLQRRQSLAANYMTSYNNQNPIGNKMSHYNGGNSIDKHQEYMMNQNYLSNMVPNRVLTNNNIPYSSKNSLNDHDMTRLGRRYSSLASFQDPSSTSSSTTTSSSSSANTSLYLSRGLSTRFANSNARSTYLSPINKTFPEEKSNNGRGRRSYRALRRTAPKMRKLKTKSDLRPFINRNPKFRRASSSKDSYISPLSALTNAIGMTYSICNSEFSYKSSKNPRRVLTKPSIPKSNNGCDNEDSDYILYVNDVLGSEENKKYMVLDILGQGTFGQVVKCQNLKTQELLAVKIVKSRSAFLNQSLTEASILEFLNKKVDPEDKHHFLKLKDKFMHKNHLCLVFELLSSNLYELIRQNQFHGLSIKLIRKFTSQMLDSLCVLKESKLIHCDLKPENILLVSLDKPDLKVIDFGSACHERNIIYTYIQSRFYRSPEVMLGLSYTSSIDMWSLGCIVAELFLGLPLFPGTSEYDQLVRIINMLGMPPNWMIEMGKTSLNFLNQSTLANGKKQYSIKPIDQYSKEFNLKENPGKNYFTHTELTDIIREYQLPKKNMTPSMIEKELSERRCLVHFLRGVLNLNPLERWTPHEAMAHPFITGAVFSDNWTPAVNKIVNSGNLNNNLSGSSSDNNTFNKTDNNGALLTSSSNIDYSSRPMNTTNNYRHVTSASFSAASSSHVMPSQASQIGNFAPPPFSTSNYKNQPFTQYQQQSGIPSQTILDTQNPPQPSNQASGVFVDPASDVEMVNSTK